MVGNYTPFSSYLLAIIQILAKYLRHNKILNCLIKIKLGMYQMEHFHLHLL